MSPWFLLVVLSLATFILTKLIVDLDFPPVLWLRDRVIGGWRPLTLGEQRGDVETTDIDGDPHIWIKRSPRVPLFFAELMSCPWCVSGWVSAGVTAGVWATVGLPVPVLVWPAVWAVGALLAVREWA